MEDKKKKLTKREVESHLQKSENQVKREDIMSNEIHTNPFFGFFTSSFTPTNKSVHQTLVTHVILVQVLTGREAGLPRDQHYSPNVTF